MAKQFRRASNPGGYGGRTLRLSLLAVGAELNMVIGLNLALCQLWHMVPAIFPRLR